jgi:hypothetical protein
MPRKTKNKKCNKKKGGVNKTYTKDEAKNKLRKDYNIFLKMLEDKYNIYVGSDLVTSSERMQKNNLFKEMCKEEGIEPSYIDPSVNTFEELFDKYKFSKLIKLLFEKQYIDSINLESVLNLEGGENTSPNTKAARVIQSRFRGNKDRKYAETKKQLKNLRDNDVFNMINMHYKNMTGKDLSGRGKKKKSKKITRKKSKSRSKKGG